MKGMSNLLLESGIIVGSFLGSQISGMDSVSSLQSVGLSLFSWNMINSDKKPITALKNSVSKIALISGCALAFSSLTGLSPVTSLVVANGVQNTIAAMKASDQLDVLDKKGKGANSEQTPTEVRDKKLKASF